MQENQDRAELWPDWLKREYQFDYTEDLLKECIARFSEEKFNELRSMNKQKDKLVREKRFQDASALRDREDELLKEFLPIHKKISDELDEKYYAIQNGA